MDLIHVFSYSVSAASVKLNWDTLTPREALYFGLVPSMIYLTHKMELPSFKQMQLIEQCETDGLVTNESIKKLLASFIDGNPKNIPAPLLVLMNTVGKNKVSWIPYYLDLVLRSFSNIESLNLNTRSFLLTIADMLNQFRTGKKDSGEDWESLFIVVLLVRLLSNTMNIFFTLNRDESYSVSFNTYFNSRDKSFESFTEVDDFAANIRPPPNFPHVSVYYPTHAKFEELDIILAVWKNVNF